MWRLDSPRAGQRRCIRQCGGRTDRPGQCRAHRPCGSARPKPGQCRRDSECRRRTTAVHWYRVVLYRAHSCSSASEHEFDSSVALPFHAKPSLVKSLVCSAANDTFVTCSKDNTIRLWDLNTCDRLHASLWPDRRTSHPGSVHRWVHADVRASACHAARAGMRRCRRRRVPARAWRSRRMRCSRAARTGRSVRCGAPTHRTNKRADVRVGVPTCAREHVRSALAVLCAALC